MNSINLLCDDSCPVTSDTLAKRTTDKENNNVAILIDSYNQEKVGLLLHNVSKEQ